MDTILEQLHTTRQAARKLIQLNNEDINLILNRVADAAILHTPALLAANQLDLERMDPADPKYDRLLLNPKRLEDIAQDIRK
ncbi:MAG: gamma-glutamyl-phosphate reductase, partial [Saprospiraceae bacterium]